MFWQRLTAQRALIDVPVDGRGSRRSHTPLVIREPEAGWWEAQTRSTVSVAAVLESEAGRDPEQVGARLAEVATDDELLVVIGAGGHTVRDAIVTELRTLLPLHRVVTMRMRHRHGELLRDAATVERLLDAGNLPVVVTPPAALHDVTAEIASYLRADRVLRVLRTELHQVWQRPSINLN
ncbi:hypothetical protein [Paractinoplanes toevensis]|uniref:Uncharacterized protein n=1 Tax=Paractinoplanes toevensis TaxID=571911 RepID=A0A919TIQ9_9ACTN|nr:hypothetical protein [Actinoplanes toevensis]GIM94646.1 hypothetical protein Ato02nite_064390 [Actinoplanes toevensis]